MFIRKPAFVLGAVTLSREARNRVAKFSRSASVRWAGEASIREARSNTTATLDDRLRTASRAAFTAAAGASSARDGGGGVTSFTAGDVSVRCREGGACAGAAELLALAERLMGPYVGSDDFAFRGVRT